MNEAMIPRLRQIERRTIAYSLPPGAAVLVRQGQAIGTGTPLARVPRSPVIEPYAADLGATPAEARAALAVRDGARVRGGELIARRRSGLRTAVLTALTNGIVAVRPEEGLYTLAPVVPTEIVSRYGGVVEQVSPEAVVVAAAIERVRCAFTSPHAVARGSLVALSAPPTRIEATAAGDIVLVPHLVDLALLRAFARAGIALLVAGTVADPVAWELLTARTRAGAPFVRVPHIAVIGGPGDAAEGARIFAALRPWENRAMWLELHGGLPVICTEAPFGRVPAPGEPAVNRIILRDPAHWSAVGTIVPPAPTAVGAPDRRFTVRVPTEGNIVIPPENAMVSLDETYE